VTERRKRILLAEDDPGVAELLTRLLSTSYDVIHAPDGQRALELAQEDPPDLLLLDVMMPNLDGFAVAEELKKKGEGKHPPIIFITAKGSAMDVIHGIQKGARAYITKPFQIKDVLEKVRKAIGP